MNRKIWTIVISTACLLSGCANPRDPLASRERAYERLLSFIEPGMTRRQLYALLPPRRTPVAHWSGPITMSGVYGGGLGLDLTYSERHELDRQFFLLVQYRLADPREFPRLRVDIPKPGTAISGNAIDALLFGSWSEKRIKSAQNLDDEVVSRPDLLRSHDRGSSPARRD